MAGQTGYYDDTSAEHPLIGGSVDSAVMDADAKRILRYRLVLANILKYAIPKYSGYSAEEIKEMIPASDRTSDGFYVREENTEDNEDRKHIDFDVLFPVAGEQDKVSIWCDIEPQGTYMTKTDAPRSYDLAARGVYYLSRMVSRQISTGAELSNYRQLKKCYSIWICFDKLDDKTWVPTVTRHGFCPLVMPGASQPPQRETEAADLMELIIIRAGGRSEELSDSPSLIGLVNALWRDINRLSVYIPDKSKEYSVINKEADDVCDMKLVGKAQGRAEGIEIGVVKGIEIGEVKGEAKGIINLGSTLGLSKNQILDHLMKQCNISFDEAVAYYKKYSGNN